MFDKTAQFKLLLNKGCPWDVHKGTMGVHLTFLWGGKFSRIGPYIFLDWREKERTSQKMSFFRLFLENSRPKINDLELPKKRKCSIFPLIVVMMRAITHQRKIIHDSLYAK